MSGARPLHANGGGPSDGRVVAAAAGALRDAEVVAPAAAVAEALGGLGVNAEHGAVAGRQGLDAVALLADELDTVEPEGLLAAAAGALRPGGLLAVSTGNLVHAMASGRGPGPAAAGHRADELVRVLGHRGLDVELLVAPGAAAVVRGDPAGGYDPELDRHPSLLGAGPRLVAVARLAADEHGRSERFFATLPRKVVASAVLCRHADGRVLVVHDSFKQHWTIPGGVVDADEDPRSGAVREAWEEAGVRVDAGALLGVFAGTWPDRLLFVYAAVPAAADPGRLHPVHAHEIDAARWVTLDDALELVAPFVRRQIERCIAQPGHSWAE